MESGSKTAFRSHTCDELRPENIGQSVVLAGFVNRVRDHGGLLFIDLRDHYGITQCVSRQGDKVFSDAESLKDETIIKITGKIAARSAETINPNLKTGEIEILADEIEILSKPESPLPIQVNVENEFPEDARLTYRYLDLRKKERHDNIILRSKIISFIRNEMVSQGFLEIQTPILTSSSPEGARDYLVPSRLHHGKFYALPQAPQQFKQLLMSAGFDKYFQIAPCFRDEDARADRSPGEFYQLDFEMSFVSQEDVFAAIEPVLYNTFAKFAPSGYSVSNYPFQKITFEQSMARYGSDKPDLRNPLVIEDLSDLFEKSGFSAFSNAVKNGAKVKSVNVPNCAKEPRSFFDKLNDWAKEIGLPGLGYISVGFDFEFKGPIAKLLNQEELNKIAKTNKSKPGDAVFFVCDKNAEKLAGTLRTKLGAELSLIDEKRYEFCWIVDFPMYEYDEELRKIAFSHNPFSMPQGGLDSLLNKNPLEIKAYQYDLVCNGIELSSGAIRNHVPEIMYKAFEIAGYGPEVVESKFGALLKAFKYGAPPHGGCAPGIDRIVMLLARTENIREIIAFPFNQQAQDLMMGAPAEVSPAQLKELNIAIASIRKQT